MPIDSIWKAGRMTVIMKVIPCRFKNINLKCFHRFVSAGGLSRRDSFGGITDSLLKTYFLENVFFDLRFVSAGGLEPPTLCLKGRCSTPELRALFLRQQI